MNELSVHLICSSVQCLTFPGQLFPKGLSSFYSLLQFHSVYVASPPGLMLDWTKRAEVSKQAREEEKEWKEENGMFSYQSNEMLSSLPVSIADVASCDFSKRSGFSAELLDTLLVWTNRASFLWGFEHSSVPFNIGLPTVSSSKLKGLLGSSACERLRCEGRLLLVWAWSWCLHPDAGDSSESVLLARSPARCGAPRFSLCNSTSENPCHVAIVTSFFATKRARERSVIRVINYFQTADKFDVLHAKNSKNVYQQTYTEYAWKLTKLV